MSNELSKAELTRYSRHLLLPEVALQGQSKLKQSRVLVVGAGGLGCPVALYLAAAGIGTVGIVDFDKIDASNLQRQILYATDQIGESKADSAAQRLRSLNDTITIVVHETRISAADVMDIISQYDIVVDGTDNFSTRYLLNDACIIARKPYVYGSIFRFEGQSSVFTHETGCYRCLFPDPPDAGDIPNCAEAGVLGVLPGIIGSIQATEVLKLILGIGETLKGRFVLYDALAMKFEELKLKRNSKCAVCGDSPTITRPMDQQLECAVRAPASGTDANASANADYNAVNALNDELNTAQLAERLEHHRTEFILLDVRNPEEHAICHLESAILIPVSELDSRLEELDSSKEIVAYCKAGMRSKSAVALLRKRGFKALSLTGGILAWADEQDPTLTRY